MPTNRHLARCSQIDLAVRAELEIASLHRHAVRRGNLDESATLFLSEREQLREDLSEAAVTALADTCRREGTVHKGAYDQPRVEILHMRDAVHSGECAEAVREHDGVDAVSLAAVHDVRHHLGTEAKLEALDKRRPKRLCTWEDEAIRDLQMR